MSRDDNSGAIWKNDDRASDRHPHFKGQATINGVEYWVSAWKRDPDGNPKAPALRFSFTAKQTDSQRSQRAQEPDKNAPFDDDIPF